jgi:hypothetical protein
LALLKAGLAVESVVESTNSWISNANLEVLEKVVANWFFGAC